MKTFRLKTIRIFFSLLLMQMTFSTAIVFGETEQCNACGTPPAQFHQYKTFVTDVLNSIGTVGTEGKYTGKYVPPSWFQGKIFEVPEENQFTINKLISGMKDRFKKTATTFGATAAILFSIGREVITKDGVGGFLILMKGRTFVEARRMLLELDALIHDKMLELGLAGGFFDKMTPTNRDYTQQIINNYIKSDDIPNGILESAKLSEGVKYFHITEMLLRTNSAMKTFIGANRIAQFKDKEFSKGRSKDKGKGKFDIKFNYTEIENMKNGYKCARGLQGLVNCDKAFRKFLANMKDLWEGDIVENSKKSTKTIADASKKLARAFSVATKQATNIVSNAKRTELNDKDQAFLDEEEKLLMQLYGLDTSQMIEKGRLAQTNKFRSTVTAGDFSIKDSLQQNQINQNLQNQKDEIKEKGNNIIQSAKDMVSNQLYVNRSETMRNCLGDKYTKQEKKKYIRLINAYIDEHDSQMKNKLTSCPEVHALANLIEKHQYTDDNISSAPIREREEALKDNKTKDKIIALYTSSMNEVIRRQEQQSKNIILADPSDLTLFFDEIFEQTHITKEIIGNKDEGIINNLGEACNLQCKNKLGTCYYQ